MKKEISGQKQIEQALSLALTHVASTTAFHTIEANLLAIVSVVTAKIIALHLSPAIYHMLAVHLKLVVAKVFASTAVKTAVHSMAAKKAGIVLAVVVGKALAAKYAAANAALLGGFLVAAGAAAWIGWEIHELPHKMGKEVGEKVVKELRDDFESRMLELMEMVKIEMMSDPEKLAADISKEMKKDPQFRAKIKELLAENS